jgi:GT2 family glycosyltransferase/tetratricopeptide (TPR) repeat protein
VGPVSNYAAPPQQVAAPYGQLDELADFAARHRQQWHGQTQAVPRLTGFCLLVRRIVFEALGALDEQFGLGFFEDDDLCLRAQQAGFQLLLAKGVYIHHFGSRTFAGLGLQPAEQLRANWPRFARKWGPEVTRRYQLPSSWSATTPVAATPVPPVPAAPQEPAASAAWTPATAGRVGWPRVSLCLIVKNEAHQLADCLAGLAELVLEIVVVDTGSSDGTAELARQLGARVVDSPWQDSFAQARNVALEHATGDWIFWLDADDRLDETNREKLRRLLAQLPGEPLGYLLQCQSVPGPGQPRVVVDHVRLFRRHPAIRWRYRVHEQILLSIRALGGQVQGTDIVIQHLGYQDARLHQAKLTRNQRLLEQQLAELPDDAYVLFYLGWTELQSGQLQSAIGHLERSLAQASPQLSLLPKIYAVLVQAWQQVPDGAQARQVCRQGRQRFPNDSELLFLDGTLLFEQGELAEAEACFQSLLQPTPAWKGNSLDLGLHGYKSRHQLALLCQQQRRWTAAAEHWQAATRDCPQFLPAWLGLGELQLLQQQWTDFQTTLAQLQQLQPAGPEVAILQARELASRQQWAAARQRLETALGQQPRSLPLRVTHSQVLFQENAEPAAIEQAFQAVLELAPQHKETQRLWQRWRQQQAQRGLAVQF